MFKCKLNKKMIKSSSKPLIPETNSTSPTSLKSIIEGTNIYIDCSGSDSETINLDPKHLEKIMNQNSEDDSRSEEKKVHLLRKPDSQIKCNDKTIRKVNCGIIKEEFQEPDISYKVWESKNKRPENISGHSKKSGVLYDLMGNQISFRVKKEYQKLMRNLTQKYQENDLALDDTLGQNLVQTCVDFTKTLKKTTPKKKVFMRPLFVAVSYCLLRAECKDNDFLVELRDIMDYVNPQNSRKFKTKMVLFYLKKFKSIYQYDKMKQQRELFLGKRDNMNENNFKKEETIPDSRKIKQIFRINAAIFQKLSIGNPEFREYQTQIQQWAEKIFYFREPLIQTLLCKKVKNVGLALLFLSLTIVFPHQQMNLTDFLDQVNQKNQDVNAQSSKFFFFFFIF